MSADTDAKVQILTHHAPQRQKLGVLSLLALLVQKYRYWVALWNGPCRPNIRQKLGAQLTCFTSAKVQILSHLAERSLLRPNANDNAACYDAVLVRKYRYWRTPWNALFSDRMPMTTPNAMTRVWGLKLLVYEALRNDKRSLLRPNPNDNAECY